MDIQKFTSGKWMGRAAGIGIVGLAATFAGMAIDPRAAFFSYLVAFAYWGGIVFGSLILLMVCHAFRAKWPTVIRRPIEVMATASVIFIPLFVPIVLGMPHLYAKWVAPGPETTAEALKLLAHKAPYLNSKFFIIRGICYLTFVALLAQRFFGLSSRQDQTGDPQLTAKARKMAVGFLPFVAVAVTFASFDWLMSLEPLWYSTIFGVYYFAGSFFATMAVLIIVTVSARGPGRNDLFGEFVSVEHLHNIAKLMFAFTCFWGYIAVSQLLLIWIANLPEETPWYLVRFSAGWKNVGILLILGHFFFPFGLMLSRARKRDPKRIKRVAIWALFIHFVDIYWLVIPTFSPQGATFHWTLVTAWLGVGCTAIAFVMWKIRGHYTVPVKDPYLAVSLRYRQP